MREKIILSCFFSCLVIGLYTGIWFYVAKKFEARMDQLYYVEAPQFGITLSSNSRERVTGYPFWPYAKYRGQINFPGDVVLSTKSMLIKPSIFDVEAIKLSFPKGVSLKGLKLNQYMSFDEVLLNFKLTGGIPLGTKEFFIQQWYDNAGGIDVKQLKIFKDSVNPLLVEVAGSIKLDLSLQPFIEADITVRNPKDFANYIFWDSGWPTPVKKVVSMLRPIVEQDDKTGDFFIETGFDIKNGTLFIGSVPFVDMPDIKWEE